MLYWACFIINLAVCEWASGRVSTFFRQQKAEEERERERVVVLVYSLLLLLFCLFRERAPTTLSERIRRLHCAKNPGSRSEREGEDLRSKIRVRLEGKSWGRGAPINYVQIKKFEFNFSRLETRWSDDFLAKVGAPADAIISCARETKGAEQN